MIVMKFGGTSVEDATAIRRLVSIVRRQSHRRPVVVVSAMGRTTNGLLDCARAASAGDMRTAQSSLDEIAAHHFKTADQLAPQQEIQSLREALGERFIALRSTLEEIGQTGRVTPRLSDAVSSNGELLSSLIVAAALRADGMKGVWVDVRPMMRTNDDFTRAAPQFDVANPKLKEGIMTTDPRVAPEAAKVKVISFAEASELAYFGAKVLHPSTLLPAMSRGIPARVCNSRRPDTSGTSIVRDSPPSRAVVKAIAFKRGI